MKKVLALVLALMMAVSLMVTANAAAVVDDADEIDPKYQEAVDVLAQLGILDGTGDQAETDDGNKHITFLPKEYFDRAQFAKILFTLYTGADPEDAKFAKYNVDIFEDTPDKYKKAWALVSINYLNEIGAMVGVGNGNFEADRTITGYEVVRGLLQALGVGQLGEFDKPWNEAVVDVAIEGEKRHITTGLGLTLSKDLTREQVIGLLFNTLTNKEAHKVTYTAGSSTYNEEVNGFVENNWVTLGEANWGLHRFSIESGKTYESDKALCELDEFGRPTNPKWVGYVDGEPVLIGTDSKALKEYYQKDKITRKELEQLFYENFATKDGFTNTEFYIDGHELEPGETPWEYAANNSRDYDKIGGAGVTVEVYMMADKYTAISSEKDLDYLGNGYGQNEGDTTVGSNANTWPRMRVVIVHHYAAQLSSDMILAGGTYKDDDENTYTSAANLKLPYDNYDYTYTVTGSVPTVTRDNVFMPVASADEYKPDDVIYYDVAIEKDKNGDVKHTVYNAQKLTASDGIAYVDPDQTYIRLENGGDAKYISYFMQVTKIPNHSYKDVKAGKDQAVYLDPTGKFVVLVAYKEAPTVPTPPPTGYYYLESFDISVKQTNKIVDGTATVEYSLDITANGYDLPSGEAKTWTGVHYRTAAPQPDASGNWTITHIAGCDIDDITLDVSAITGTTTIALASIRATDTVDLDTVLGGTAEGDDYELEGDTEIIKIAAPVTVLLDGENANSTDKLDVYVYADKHDKNGNLVFFVIAKDDDGNDVTYVLDLYSPYIDKAHVSVKTLQRFDTTKSYNAYKTANELFDENGIRAYGNVKPEDITKANALEKKPVTPPPAAPVDYPALDELTHQFVRETKATNDNKTEYGPASGVAFVYDLIDVDTSDGKVDYVAYDHDAKLGYDVISGILVKNGPNSISVLKDGDDPEDKTPVYVNENTMLYALIGTYADEENGDLSYEDLELKGTYKAHEFDEFFTDDEDPYVLVVCDHEKTYPVASYIVVICTDAVKHDETNAFYGIYCGFDEIDGSDYLYFVDPRSETPTLKTYKGSASVITTNKELRKYVGLVVKATVNDDNEVTKIELAEGLTLADLQNPENLPTISGFTAKTLVTADKDGETTQYSLEEASFYYVGGNFLTKVTAEYLKVGATVYVHKNLDGTVTVVIYALDYLKSLDDGAPYYGNLDLNWDGRK